VHFFDSTRVSVSKVKGPRPLLCKKKKKKKKKKSGGGGGGGGNGK